MKENVKTMLRLERKFKRAYRDNPVSLKTQLLQQDLKNIYMLISGKNKFTNCIV